MGIDRLGNVHGIDGRFESKCRRAPSGVDDLTPFPMSPTVDMARGLCIEYAKRRIIDLIWKASNIEVKGLTFPETADIINGVNPQDSPVEARRILVVNNIKHAWQYLLEHVGDPLDWRYLCDYNRICGQYVESDPGRRRSLPVRISGTRWRPSSSVSEEEVFRGMEETRAESDPINQAVHMFAVVCRGQWFGNGNKRTATMAANHMMIHAGEGIFALPPQRMQDDFRDELLRYYETNDVGRFVDWLKYYAIGRIDDDGMTRAQMDGVDPIDRS